MGNYVWYVSYGSNLLKERFLCYIEGGRPQGATKAYSGCVDKSHPTAEKPYVIPHMLYFAREAKVWSNGGVAFIHREKDKKERTFARMYRITEEQFFDVVMQENALDFRPEISLPEAKDNGSYHLKDAGWYDLLLYLGEENGEPIFTFTSKDLFQFYHKPHESYLKTIIAGIRETHQFGEKVIFDYLEGKQGIYKFFDNRRLKELTVKI